MMRSGPARTPLTVRFKRMVDERGEDECWPWLGSKNKAGYGSIVVAGRNGPKRMAHRVAYEIAVGPIPDGLEIDHLCENTSCVNPKHLEAVTHQVNVERALAKRDTCRLGHKMDAWALNGEGVVKRRYCRICKAKANRESRRRRLARRAAG